MAERLAVRATYRGPWATDVGARGHEIRIDEPTSANGDDTGMMPTEAFLASLAAIRRCCGFDAWNRCGGGAGMGPRH